MASEKYVSGEEYQKIHQASSSLGGKKVTVPANSLVIVIVAIVLCGLSFAGGMTYQKHKAKPAGTATTAASGFAGRGSARRGGEIGPVTAVSNTSITVTNQRTNASKTYAITSSTTISNNGQTETASDIKTGDTVLITTGTSDAGTAVRILINPSFGGGFGGQGASAGDNPAQVN